MRGVQFIGVRPEDEDRLMDVADDHNTRRFPGPLQPEVLRVDGTGLAEELKLGREDDFLFWPGETYR